MSSASIARWRLWMLVRHELPSPRFCREVRVNFKAYLFGLLRCPIPRAAIPPPNPSTPSHLRGGSETCCTLDGPDTSMIRQRMTTNHCHDRDLLLSSHSKEAEWVSKRPDGLFGVKLKSWELFCSFSPPFHHLRFHLVWRAPSIITIIISSSQLTSFLMRSVMDNAIYSRIAFFPQKIQWELLPTL